MDKAINKVQVKAVLKMSIELYPRVSSGHFRADQETTYKTKCVSKKEKMKEKQSDEQSELF